jgi:hypothetical protein
MELSSNKSLWVSEEVAYAFTLLVSTWIVFRFLFEIGPRRPPGTSLLISKITSVFDIYFAIVTIELLYFYLVSLLIVYLYSKV